MGDSKKISKSSFRAWIVLAIIADVVSVKLGFVGVAFIFVARATFFVNGQSGGGHALLIGAFIEAIPYINKLPGCIFFVVKHYQGNKMRKKSPKNKTQLWNPTY